MLAQLVASGALIVASAAGCTPEKGAASDGLDASHWAQNHELPPEFAIRTVGVAVSTARDLLGAASLEATASLSECSDDRIPFLASALRGEKVWYVVVSSMRTDQAHAGLVENHVIDMMIMARSGQLVSIKTRWPQGVPPIWPPPPGTVAQQRMAASGETWLGLIPDRPKHSLAEILSIIELSFGGLDTATQVIAYAVLLDEPGGPKPIWSVELRGIQPLQPPRVLGIEPSAMRPNPNALNHLRHIVADSTGTWLCATTTPQPDPP